MARCALYSSLFISLLLLSTPGHGGEEIRLLGGNQFFAGAKVVREIGAGGLETGSIRWQLVTFGAVAAEGEGTGPTLEFTVPKATRHIPATLRLQFTDGRTADLPVEIIPRRIDHLGKLLAGKAIGVFGAKSRLREVLAGQQLEFDSLSSPGSIRRSPARLIFLTPGAWEVRPIWPTILEKIRGGAVVIALGPDDAPWAQTATPVPAGEGFGTWGQGEPVVARTLRPAEGNHRDIHTGLLREYYPGRGKLVLCRLRLLEHLADEPRAEGLLLDLVEKSLAPPPQLRAPGRVIPPEEEAEQWPWTAFEADGGDGPVVAAELAPEIQKLGKQETGVLIVTPETSFFLRDGQRLHGPGSADRSGFAQFVTARGIRLISEKFWR